MDFTGAGVTLALLSSLSRFHSYKNKRLSFEKQTIVLIEQLRIIQKQETLVYHLGKKIFKIKETKTGQKRRFACRHGNSKGSGARP